MYGTEKYEYTKKINEEYHDLIITVITASLYFTVIGYNRINYDAVSNFTDNSIKILSFLIPFVFMTLSYPEIEHRSGFHYSFTTKNLSKFMPLIMIILLVVVTYIGSYIHLAKITIILIIRTIYKN